MDESSALLRRFVSERSEEAFSAIVRRHSDLVYSAALRQLHDGSLAEEVTQAVFVRLVHKAHTIREGEALAGWLLSTARFTSLDMMRSSKRRRLHEREGAAMKREHDLLDARVWESLEPVLDEAMSHLSKPDRDALVLRYFEGRSADEAAAALNISPHAAQKRVERALQRLRAWFAARGLVTSTDALGIVMLSNVMVEAPLALKSALPAIALAKAGGASALLATKGTVALVAKMKANAVAVALLCAALVATAGTVAYQKVVSASDGVSELSRGGVPLAAGSRRSFSVAAGPIINPIWLTIAGIIIGVLGLWLFQVGWWPRRRGDEPHCGSCGYLLVGNQSGRCSECGLDTTDAANVAHGQRHRRGGLAATGLLCCLVAAACLWGAGGSFLQRIDWYHYRPTGWVLSDAKSSNAPRALRAWTEIGRRRSEGSLSEFNEGAVIEMALIEQAKPRNAGGTLNSQMMNYLGGRYLAGNLNEPQTGRFFEQGCRRELRVRPRVIAGEWVPYQIATTGNGPSDPGWWASDMQLGLWVDGKQVRAGGEESSGSAFGTGSTGSSATPLPPGKHALEIRQRVEVYHGTPQDKRASKRCAQREISLKGQVEVLPQGTPEHVKLIDRPDLQSAIQAGIGVADFYYPTLRGTLTMRNLSENIAFDVFVRAGGKEFPFGSVSLAKGAQTHWGLADYRNQIPEQALESGPVDLVLRSSESTARQTVDLFEIWKGELVIRVVPAKRSSN